MTPFSRRDFLGSAAASLAGARQTSRPPNVVVLFSDDQGYRDLGCYGGEFPTPQIDSIARDGVRFTNYYAAGPVCTPSRFGLLTGRYPARSRDRLLGALMPGTTKGIQPGETTIADVLKARGYRTGIFGKWHLGYSKPEFFPTRHGFDEFDGFVHGCIDFFDFTYGGMKSWYRNEELHQPARGYTTDYITDQAIGFLRRNRARPFFLYVPYNAPHYGKTEYDPVTRRAKDALQAPPEYVAKFAHIKDEKRRLYAAMVASLDDNIGRVLSTLRELELDKNTFLVFASDNGGSLPYGGRNEPLRGQKGELFEGGIRVPCLMRWPGRLKPGTVLRQVAGGVDLFPTVCSLTASPPASVDGIDLSPALFHGRAMDRELFWRTGNTDACLLGYWKYIRGSDGREFLFDLEHDKEEKANQLGNIAKLQEMRRVHQRAVSTLGG